ncbi:Proteinase inhibitor I3 Kunitz legume [Arabidopsis thaliana x Arabidopsis arenosa]|uniref:Proteinase inhibitor I3 Kunitz legume n=1 Tax=Arabidopsis thaliana x Arabidopsis arenosa TaxID=1240361 RepID=A0A8T2BXF2_9BRAS|nr:Proteinase inhibitor I3 Kunitz legume [Arabidopsis thaliana x Arabidopsis arenosa]
MSSLLYIFLLFAVFISHRGATTEAAVEPVKDINGKPLLAGYNYYILPVVRGRGGGLTMSNFKNETCPRSVIQDQFEVSQGLPVKFSPYDKSRIVRVSTDQNIKFSPTSIWELANFDETTSQWFISTCGVEGNPGQKTVGNWFKIDEFENDYKIRFCPTVCNFCKVICRDVGVFVQDGKRRLALSEVPLKVMFKKAY